LAASTMSERTPAWRRKSIKIRHQFWHPAFSY
jgi:hypothetical protein